MRPDLKSPITSSADLFVCLFVFLQYACRNVRFFMTSKCGHSEQVSTTSSLPLHLSASQFDTNISRRKQALYLLNHVSFESILITDFHSPMWDQYYTFNSFIMYSPMF